MRCCVIYCLCVFVSCALAMYAECVCLCYDYVCLIYVMSLCVCLLFVCVFVLCNLAMYAACVCLCYDYVCSSIILLLLLCIIYIYIYTHTHTLLSYVSYMCIMFCYVSYACYITIIFCAIVSLHYIISYRPRGVAMPCLAELYVFLRPEYAQYHFNILPGALSVLSMLIVFACVAMLCLAGRGATRGRAVRGPTREACVYIYIYIYIERERECICMYIYIYTQLL